MLMGAISRSDSAPLGRRLRECPGDFETMFVRLGRLECEEHYHAARDTITRWLVGCGKDSLIRERAEFVRALRRSRMRKCPPDFVKMFISLGHRHCERHYQASNRLIDRWIAENGGTKLLDERAAYVGDRRLNRRDVGRILSRAFPVDCRPKSRDGSAVDCGRP
jgi:hypothetical protein